MSTFDLEEREAIASAARSWWLFLLTGILWFLVAIIILRFDYTSVSAISILFGIVAIFVQIPNSQLIYAIAGLAIFAVLTAFDFQRLRRTQDIRAAPLLAASIFLDVLNVFLLLLSLFNRD